MQDNNGNQYKSQLCGCIIAVHNVYFVKYDVIVSFMAQVLDTVTYFVSKVLHAAS